MTPEAETPVKRVWMKFRHKFSWGTDSKWDWKEVVDDPGEIKAALDALTQRYSHSDKYRGIDYETAPHPDPEWLDFHLKELRKELKRRKKRIKRLEELAQGIRATQGETD